MITVRNEKTGETRKVKMPTLKQVENDQWNSTSICVGPCKCTTDMDGACPQGWPSRLMEYIYNI